MVEMEILWMNIGSVLAALSDKRIPDKDCLLPLISKLLGYCIVTTSTTVKLPQIGPLIVLSDTDVQDQDSSPLDLDEDPGLGLEGLDLANYLSDKAIIDAIDCAVGLLPSISSSSASASSSNDIAISNSF